MANILYAEDDRDCRELFAFALRQQDHKVHEAINGAQAVQILREEPIDLVILDARMPMTTGYDAARIIAKESPNTPVIFLSARGMHREINMAFECGPMVVDYLVKPLSPQQLVDQVEYLIKACEIRGLTPVREENMARELVTVES
ncbi:MAG TPA: response regulator [Anaerolineae bacterium]|nr:response regulator [Anaerolineae bacterium]HMR67120.1 response regulator [Anaerolineae bacterium]